MLGLLVGAVVAAAAAAAEAEAWRWSVADRYRTSPQPAEGGGAAGGGEHSGVVEVSALADILIYFQHRKLPKARAFLVNFICPLTAITNWSRPILLLSPQSIWHGLPADIRQMQIC